MNRVTRRTWLMGLFIGVLLGGMLLFLWEYEEVKEWTRRNKEKIQKSSEIASHFGYNEDYLCRIFKKHCGTSLKRYLDSVRLDGIKRELLVGSGTLLEISDTYGFTDYKYFLKFFKYHEGISPRKYRETYYNMHTN